MGIRNYLKRRRERKERIEKRAKVYEIMFTDVYQRMPFGFFRNPSEDARKLAEFAENPTGAYVLDGNLTVLSDVPAFEGFSYNYYVREKIRSETTVGLKNEPNRKN